MTTLDNASPKFAAMLMVCLVVGVAGFVLITTPLPTHLPAPAIAAHEASAIVWASSPVNIPADLIINGHAAKHIGEELDAWKLYAMLLEGQCVASTVWCGGSDIEKLYLCTTPDGLIGGLFRFGDEIMSGFQGPLDYWIRIRDRDNWEVCDD